MEMVMLGHVTSPSPFAELSVLLPSQKPAISLNFTLNVATKAARRLSNPTSGQFATTRTIVVDDSKQNVDCRYCTQGGYSRWIYNEKQLLYNV